VSTHDLVRELTALLIAGGGLWLLIQFAGLKFWHMLLALATGFYLASYTAAGPQVAGVVSRILTAFGH
jgi:hypothetical protein